MALTQAEQDHIATSINWVRQFPDLGIPGDISESDCVITSHAVTRQVMESTGPITWQETEWCVVIRQHWVVDLDSMGVPKGAPRLLRRP